MADREKVLKGLEHCLSRYVDGLCDDCPYMGELDKSYMIPMKCKEIIMRDALSLLKEQQEQIEQMNFIYGFVYGGQVKEIKKLVRCNECKHRDPEDHKCDCGHDIQWQLPRAGDWFCADGEREET